MFRYILSLALIFLTVKVFAQVKAGAKVSPPHFTNWISNVPADTSLKGKLLVIDFWATWCAPCLEGVSHINELVAANKNVKNLVFLAVTDEIEAKVRPVLKKVSFSSAVVADTTGQTFEHFKIEGIPFCALVNEQMEVQWAGSASMLTNDIIQQFIRRQKITAPSFPPGNMSVGSAQVYDSLKTLYHTVKSDTSVKNYFDVGPLLKEEKGSTLTETNSSFRAEIVMGVALQREVARLLNVGNSRVVLAPGMEGTFVSYCYKGEAIQDDELLSRIMASLKLGSTTTEEQREAIVLEVTDATKLYHDLPAPGANESRFSTDATFIAMTNNVPAAIVNGLQDRFQCAVVLEQADRLITRINMTIKTGSFAELQQSLQDYGIKATWHKLPQEIYHLHYLPATTRL